MTDVLRIEDLSAGYGPLGVLHSVNLTVRAGERVGIIGLNGHGKSTLLKAIAGLTGWQSGSIKLNGVEIGGTRSQGPGRYTHKIVRMGLALMPQGDALFHGLTVADHLDSGAFTPRAWRERKQRRERVLAIFPPLEKLLGQPVGKLSGGERRMVSLGRGLMDDAKLLLIDEPSLGLAPKISKGLVEALMQIDIKDGAMVIAEQNLSLLEGKVSRLIGLHAGKLKGGAVSARRAADAEFAHHHRALTSASDTQHRDGMDPYYLLLTAVSSGVHLRAAGARHLDHLVEPGHDQPGPGLHLHGRRLRRVAGRAEHQHQRLRGRRRRRDHRRAGRRADRRARVHPAVRQAELPAAQPDRDARDQPDGRAVPAVGLRPRG